MINILLVLAFENIVKKPEVLGDKAFIKLVELRTKIKGGETDDALQRYIKEKLKLEPSKKIAGALAPPDAEIHRESKDSSSG